jgi:hypothetical protein
MRWLRRAAYIGAGLLFLFLALLSGSLIYEYYFRPTNLVICLKERVDMVNIKLERFWGYKEYHMKSPDSDNVVRFRDISKGWWSIAFVDKNGYREYTTVFVDGLETRMNCPEDLR